MPMHAEFERAIGAMQNFHPSSVHFVDDCDTFIARNDEARVILQLRGKGFIRVEDSFLAVTISFVEDDDWFDVINYHVEDDGLVLDTGMIPTNESVRVGRAIAKVHQSILAAYDAEDYDPEEEYLEDDEEDKDEDE